MWLKPTEEDIQENLKRVEDGGILTFPLNVLDGEFKRKYFVCTNCGKPISPFSKYGLCKECYEKSGIEKEHSKEYRQNPKNKEKIKNYAKEYRQRPEVKKKMRDYQRKRYNILKSRWIVK